MICTIVSNGVELISAFENEHEPFYRTMIRELDKSLQRIYRKGYDEFWVTCERGIPLWVAERLCLIKTQFDIKLHIAVPYEETATYWPEALRDRYFKIHELADSVSLVNTQWNSQCYHEAERYMLEKSDLLFVFGSPEDKLYAVEVAKSMGINVKFIV